MIKNNEKLIYFFLLCRMREDIYKALKHYTEIVNLNDLDEESKRFIETSFIDARQNGIF